MATPLIPSVIAALTYDREDVSPRVMNDNDLKTLLPIDLRRTEPATFTNICLVGTLPLELLLLIFEPLPLLSLLRFRNTSRHARHIVDTLPQFHAIITHAPQALRGLFAVPTTVSPTLTLPKFYQKLRERTCDTCGALAPRLWLPTLSRLCYECAQFRPIPLEADELLERYELDIADLDAIPSFYFHPTTLVNDKNTYKVQQRHTLYDTAVAIQHHVTEARSTVYLPPVLLENPKLEPLLPHLQINEPVRLAPEQLPRAARLSIAMVDVPWLDDKGGAEQPLLCIMCQHTLAQYRVYTASEFAEHVLGCRVHTSHFSIEYETRACFSSCRLRLAGNMSTGERLFGGFGKGCFDKAAVVRSDGVKGLRDLEERVKKREKRESLERRLCCGIHHGGDMGGVYHQFL
jgi:hypothetical protein